MKKVCVFCGSSEGRKRSYMEDSFQLGKALAASGIGVVYGGGRTGIMASVAEGCMENGGEVVGIIPDRLMNIYSASDIVTEIKVVNDMHERKKMMHDLSSAYIILPGGIGTCEEFFEAYTWLQLGYHDKMVGILNTDGYYDRLLGFLEYMVAEDFFSHENYSKLIIEKDVKQLVKKMFG